MNMDQPLFQPYPSELVFQNYKPAQTYKLSLLLCNKSKVCVRQLQRHCLVWESIIIPFTNLLIFDQEFTIFEDEDVWVTVFPCDWSKQGWRQNCTRNLCYFWRVLHPTGEQGRGDVDESLNAPPIDHTQEARIRAFLTQYLVTKPVQNVELKI